MIVVFCFLRGDDYLMTVKEQLYYLIQRVKMGEYEVATFCDLYTNLVNLEMWKEEFTDLETTVFKELNKYTCRFSQYEEDLKIPNAFFDEDTVKKQIDIAIMKLDIKI